MRPLQRLVLASVVWADQYARFAVNRPNVCASAVRR